MGSQGISGDNISGTMNRIEDMLDYAIQAYENSLTHSLRIRLWI
jgi:hypothetical protein